MSIHTKIEQPISIRKDLLEGAIDSVEVLKTIENFRKIQHEKDIIRRKLKIVLDKLKVLDKRLLKNMPGLPRERKPRREFEEPIPRKAKKTLKKSKKATQKPKVNRFENKMSSELDALRHKIEDL